MRGWFALALVCVACGNVSPGASDGAAPDASQTNDASMPVDAALDANATDAAIEAGADAASGYGPYGADGPSAVTVSTASVSGSSGAFTVDVYLPSGGGPFPFVVFTSGFFQPALAYDLYARRLASWGVAAVLRDDPGVGEGSAAIASDVVAEIVSWAPSYGKLDTTKVGLAGHSRGGQVSLLAAEGGAKGHVLGVFGLDPVDGAPAALPSIGSIGVPVAFVGETTDSAGTNACAPAAQNFQALYGGASAPAVAIDVANADHTMFEDPAHCAFCGLCQAGTADGASVRALSSRYLMAFFARVLLGDASVGAAFENAGAPLDVSAGLVTIASK